MKKFMAVIPLLALVACHPDLPAPKITNKEATAVLREAFGAPASTPFRVLLGTCIPPIKPRYKNQISCTVLVVTAGTSESLMDFYWDGQKWIPTASESGPNELLPFPDPIFAGIDAWTPNLDQLEPKFLEKKLD